MKLLMMTVALCMPIAAMAHNQASNLAPTVEESAEAARYENNFDRMGGDYLNFDLRTPRAATCQMRCMRDYRCKAWTYVKPGVQGRFARCWLKSTVPQGHPSNCCISGTKRGWGTASD